MVKKGISSIQYFFKILLFFLLKANFQFNFQVIFSTVTLSIIGEAVLTTSIELLIMKLASSELLSFASQEKVIADLKEWETKLKILNAVFQDAEEKQITNPVVKDWLDELEALAYDVEDILDEFATKLSHESEASTSTSTSKQPWRLQIAN